MEEKGTGVNKYTYYAANDVVNNKWTKLPDLKPSHIRSARSIKVHFTGDLERKIIVCPPFNGLEKHYLRA